MARYFLEVAYLGTKYSGFQIQENSNTIQAEVEKALKNLHRTPVQLTGSSRTDSGVHALQNYFHFDFEGTIKPHLAYKMNALLPKDVVVRNFFSMPPEAHCRFDAISREYVYRIHRFKNPFITDTSFFYPYKLDFEMMQLGANFIKEQQNFFSFSKTNTQVKNFNCMILKSEWQFEKEEMCYKIEANRFLRGMVRLITSTLLKLGRGKITLKDIDEMVDSNRKCGYSVPPHGLALSQVLYPMNYFSAMPLDLTKF